MPPPHRLLLATLLLGCGTRMPAAGITVADAPPEEGLPLVVPPAPPLEATMAEPSPDDRASLDGPPTANVGCIGPPSRTALLRPQRAVCCYTPPAVFQRRVMLQREAFRACYDEGLRRRPGLRGRVAARFTIEEDGTVARACDAGSNLQDADTVRCVLRAFTTVTFEGYTVDDPCPPITLTYPLAFDAP